MESYPCSFKKLNLPAIDSVSSGRFRGKGTVAFKENGISISGRHVYPLSFRLGITITIYLVPLALIRDIKFIGYIFPLLPFIYLFCEYIFLKRVEISIPFEDIIKFEHKDKKKILGISFRGSKYHTPVILSSLNLIQIIEALQKTIPDKEITEEEYYEDQAN